MTRRDTDSGQTVGTLGERALIERLGRRVAPAAPGVVLGIGDDAAVLEPARGELDVLAADSLVEDVHFRRTWTRPHAVGHKALAVNLSDLAAMGAVPRACLLSLALPPELSAADFDELINGFADLADAHGATLVGGNIARSPGPLVLDVTVLGAVRRRHVLRRSGGRAGDEVYVTGTVGGAGAGLALLEDGVDRDALGPALADGVARYERPSPRLRPGRIIARQRAATAAIDLSDGPAEGGRQLAAASGTGLVIEADQLPLHPGLVEYASRAEQDPVKLALASGEDYELLFAVSPRRRRTFLAASRRFTDVPVTRIGRLTREPGCWLEVGSAREPLAPGFRHFGGGGLGD